MNSIYDSFYNNLIAEDRYRMILDGLQVTLVITICAAILGTLLGGLVCSEQSGVTSLDFMVEKMTSTPLSDAQRTELAAECKQVVEEPTERGFRVKLII